MKRKWKLDKGKGFSLERILLMLCMGTILLVSNFSCIKSNEDKHIPSIKMGDLDGLAQPTNQTIFSDVNTISPFQKTITPIINATGIISYDPELLSTISSRFSGRIERLYVRFNFENVVKGQRIMDVYSPEILTEQQNLIYLLNNSTKDISMISSSKQKLQLLGLTNEQIHQIETKRVAINPLPVYSFYSGHIHDIGIGNGVSSSSPMNSGMGSNQGNSSSTSKEQIENLPSSQSSALTIKEGMYLQSGQAIFAVYNINKVWAILNIFPRDAALIKVGDKVTLNSETNPTKNLTATINYLEPVTGKNAFTIKARVYIQNADNLHLKIGTLLSAKITTKEINGLWLPRKAVVNLGQKQIVFQKNGNFFNAKSIKTGIETDSLFQILSGLENMEKLADNAQYFVDSESFIESEENEKKSK